MSPGQQSSQEPQQRPRRSRGVGSLPLKQPPHTASPFCTARAEAQEKAALMRVLWRGSAWGTLGQQSQRTRTGALDPGCGRCR